MSDDDTTEFLSDYVTIDCVASLLDISRSSVIRALNRGDIKRIHLGPALVRVYMPSVWEWVERNTETSPATRGA